MGFGVQSAPQMMLVDVYFGGERLGETRVELNEKTLRLLAVAEVVAMLPALRDRQAVATVLGRSDLETNAFLSCGVTSDSSCGSLSPDIAGVIFNRDRFRLDVFLNPRFLDPQRALSEVYLPKPDRSLSMVSSVGGLISGQTGGQSSYNLQNDFIVGNGERRLRGSIGYASDFGLETDALAVEWDQRGVRYAAGLLWSQGTDATARRKIAGAGISSQIDTRTDRENLLGTPLIVFLGRRARVDILREGRLVHSALYQPGSQSISTDNLPDGAYQVTLRIYELDGGMREEARFFTKSRRIPSLGRTDFFAFAGAVTKSDISASELGNPLFVQGGIAHRLGQSWAVDAVVQAVGGSASAEVGATWLAPAVQVRAAALRTDEGALGGLLRVASTGGAKLNFNLDMRVAGAQSLSGLDRLYSANNSDGAMVAEGGAGAERPFAQLSGTVAYGGSGLRLLGSGYLRDEKGERARYSLGPTLEWDVLRKGPLTVTLRGDMTLTDHGEAGFAGIAVRMYNGRSAYSSSAGLRHSTSEADKPGNGAVADISASWTKPMAFGEVAVGAGYEKQPDQASAVITGELRNEAVSLAGDFVHSAVNGESSNQYTFGAQSTLIAGGGGIQIAGRSGTRSMIVARIVGARTGDRFEVLVNEQVAGMIQGASSATIALAPYHAYDIRVRSIGSDLISYDTAPKRVSLYPGGVTALAWDAKPIVIKFGRLATPEGRSIAHAAIVGSGVWAETDSDGRFQIEVADGALLAVTTPDHRTFELQLPSSEAGSALVKLGDVLCCGVGEPRLGVLSEKLTMTTGNQP